MDRKKERQLAQLCLAYRQRGVSFREYLRHSAWNFVGLALIGLLLSIFGLKAKAGEWTTVLCSLGVGMILGALLRDAGWIRKYKMTWSFTNQVTDWRKVEELARDDRENE